MGRYALFFVALAQCVLAAKNPACSKGIYSKLAKYSSAAQVSSFCHSKFPQQTQTSIVSTTSTTTVTLKNTITTTTDTTIIVTQTAVETVTVTVNAPVKVKRHNERGAKPKVAPAKATPTPVKTCPELAALRLLAANVVQTACSCILSTPTVTATKTATRTATAQTTTILTVANVITSTTTTTSTSTATATATPYPLPPTCLNPSDVGCSSAVPCGGGNSGNCICEQTIEGRNVCIDESNQNCGAACTSSAACGDGYSCVTSTCCGAGVCLKSGVAMGNTCTSVETQVVRMLRGIEKRATVGMPLHLPPTSN